MEIRNDKGQIKFVNVVDGEEKPAGEFGYLRGPCKWAKVLEADQYGNFAVDVYASEEDREEFAKLVESISEEAKTLVEGLKKKVAGIADSVKEDGDGKQYIQFKRKEYKGPPKIYDKFGNEASDWDKLVGNGSDVKIAYFLSPYYMASTKMVGVSCKFYAIQVIDLVEYEGVTASNTGFGDESGNDSGFADGEEF